jgi:uncharacterized membrane protein (UPF0127 family)
MIIDEIKMADKFFSRLRGYMFYKEPPVKALAIKPCNSIHTYFMRFPIDVIFLDGEMCVLEKYENLGKNKMVYVKEAKYVIETSIGNFNNIQVGDIMSIC